MIVNFARLHRIRKLLVAGKTMEYRRNKIYYRSGALKVSNFSKNKFFTHFRSLMKIWILIGKFLCSQCLLLKLSAYLEFF